MKKFFLIVISSLLIPSVSIAQTVDYLNAKPLTDVVNISVKSCSQPNVLQIPVIAWGADTVMSLANGNATRTSSGSIFSEKNLDISLYRQDNFIQQVRDYMSCKTPYLRGTLGMISQANELLSQNPNTKPVIIHQLSWSSGGDALVVREGINSPSDLRGKTIVMQAYGPHVDYALKVISDAGIDPSDVEFRYVKDLLEIDDNSVSPAMAFRNDSSIDAAFVILPDALALTSDGNVGTGAEDSVLGAKILFSTKTANRIITDVYAVRSDYLQVNRDSVNDFVHGLLIAQEQLENTMKLKSGNYDEILSASADLLLDDREAKEDVIAMYGDADLMGYPQNVDFFGNSNSARNFERLVTEVQKSLLDLGMVSKITSLDHAKWDYAKLALGLKNTSGVEVPRFESAVVQKVVESRTRQGSSEEGVLFRFEIYFDANQNAFPVARYQEESARVVDLASTYGGAILSIEGHSDPLGYLRKKKSGDSAKVLSAVSQSAKNLSYSRANAVKDMLISYASQQGITLDSSQFGIVGHGVSQPNTPNCTLDSSGDISLSCAPANEAEWNRTRRVVFKIIQVEAESSVFTPL